MVSDNTLAGFCADFSLSEIRRIRLGIQRLCPSPVRSRHANRRRPNVQGFGDSMGEFHHWILRRCVHSYPVRTPERW